MAEGSGSEFSTEGEKANHGPDIIDRLIRGKLPQMVDWFDPGLLAKVGVRAVISATLGSYTDQRLIQAATDIASEAELKARYDYSETGRPADRMPTDAEGGVWVDYIADLGDGFEATYAMAYLLAADQLKVRGEAQPLPAGKLLIMGGDQVYPDATKQEYHTRLRDPYDWAFSTEKPQRKLFAIPGNHDWYDGLSAFSALFCSARDRISGGVGTQIGGWRCHQHRSYFAIKLPYDWWIWGPDIQLADNLDDCQRDYFDLIAEQTGPGHKIILCLAEPSWLHKNYDNLHEISMLARKNGAKICAVVAGDWHHYSRYHSEKLGIEFITCGGGGAFAHATHGLRNSIHLSWATPTGDTRRSSPADTLEFDRLEKSVIEPGGIDFTQSPDGAVVQDGGAPAEEPKPISDIDVMPARRLRALRKEDIASKPYECQATAIYPPKWKSRLLCLKNLFLPFRNRRFAVMVGVIYFVFAWAWSSSDPRQSPVMQKLAEDVAIEAEAARVNYESIKTEIKTLDAKLRELEAAQGAAANTAAEYIVMVDRLARVKGREEPAKQTFDDLEVRSKALDGGRKIVLNESIRQLESTPDQTATWRLRNMIAFYLQYSPLEGVLNPTALLAACEQGPFFAFMLLGLWVGLVWYVEASATVLGSAKKFVFGTAHFAAHLMALLAINWIATGVSVPMASLLQHHIAAPWPDVVRVSWNFLATLILGGLIGGFVMGLYWTITSTLFNMHTGDAFGALGIRHYKSFLRLRLEPDRATIYPIALDHVPGRFGWRARLDQGEARPSHNPQILPSDALAPRLIEEPIRIDVSKVSR